MDTRLGAPLFAPLIRCDLVSHNDALSVTIYVRVDETMKTLGHQSHSLAALSDAEVLTVAVVAARACGHHQRRALDTLYARGYLTARLSPARFNRRLHALAAWLPLLVDTVGACVVQAQAAICDFVIASLPVPVCRRVRAWRCGQVRGREYCGYCAATQERFCGWRWHWVCTTDGVPGACVLLPARYHDLTPIHGLLYGLPPGADVYADKADNSADDAASILAQTGVHLVPLRKDNMAPNTGAERCGLRTFRMTSATVNSQCAAMGLPRLRARTNAGFELKVQASILALACANMD